MNGRFTARTSINDLEDLEDTPLPLTLRADDLEYAIPIVDTEGNYASPFSYTPLSTSSPGSSFANVTSLATSAFQSTQPSPTIPTQEALPTEETEYHGPMERIPIFVGTGEDEVTSKDFMKIYRRATINNSNMNTDAARIENFQNYLGSDSPAEEWYEDEGKVLTKWTEFEAAFFAKFPTIDKARKTTVELERELAGLRLRVEDLGKKEKYGGQEVWSHIAFAENAINLARRAKIEKGTSSLWPVRDELPEVIREKVPENQTSWETFCAAIKAIEMGHIRDGVRKHSEEAEKTERLRREIISDLKRTQTTAVASPTAAIRTQFRNTTISQPGPGRASPTTNANPFSNQGGGRGNLFTQTRYTPTARTPGQPRAPATEADRTALRTRLETYPMQPDTPEGNATYLRQLSTWRTTNPSLRPTEHTGFPLKPGGAPPGSGECYRCGRGGHRRPECNAEQGQLIPPLEGTFRAICGSILGFSNRTAAQINMVDNAEEDDYAWVFGNTTARRIQGNEEGPSAG